MQATRRLRLSHVLSALLPLLLLFSHACSRGVDRNWRWTPDLVETLDDLDACPGCSAAVDDVVAENYQPLAPSHDVDLQKLKRTRKNYLTMQETCECTTDFNKWNVRNLSSGQYPSAVSEINCTAESCSNCHLPYVCTAHRYWVHVLTEKVSTDPIDAKMPDMLKQHWKFVKEPISIGCKCIKSID